jgi:hypothetical protein
MHVGTFISLNPVAGPSYAGLDASMKIPVAKLGVGAGAKAGAGKYELSGELNTPFTGSALQGKAAATVGDYARAGVGLAGNALSAGRAKLSGDVASATAAGR